VSRWPEVELGSICELRYGKALAAQNRTGEGFPVYGSNGVVGAHATALTSGPTIVVGRKGSFGEVTYSPQRCWPIDTTYYIDETSTQADLRWLSYRLERLGLTSLNRAAAVPGLNREDAYRQRLLLPPLEEQRRIAAILDQADAIRTKRRQVLAHLDTLTQSIYHDAARAARERATLRALDVDFVSGKNVLGGDTDHHASNRIIKVSAVSSGVFALAESKPMPGSYVPPDAHRIRCGDILFGRASGSLSLLGATAVVDVEVENLYLPDKVWRLSVKQGSRVLPAFVLGALRSEPSRRFIQHHASGAAGVRNISKAKLLGLEIPVPDLGIQREYGSDVATITTHRAAVARALAADDELFTALRSRAFHGQMA